MLFCAQKTQKAQDVKQATSSSQMFLCAQKCCLFYFYWLMCVLCFLSQTSYFFPLSCFYAYLKLSLFLFAYVSFVRVRSFRKRYKTPLVPSSTILLQYFIIFPLLQYISITTKHFHYYNIFPLL